MKLLDRRFLNISLAVRAIANEPAANPSVGTQYIVGAAATEAFASIPANSIARYNGSDWEFSSPKQGELEVLNIETGQILAFNGSAWTSVASLGSSAILPVHGIVDFFNHDGATAEHLPGQFGIFWNGSGYAFCSATFEYNSASKNFELPSPSIRNGQRFAAGLNGKIFTITDSQTRDSVVEESLSDGDLIFNLTDNSFYAYSATAHRLVKLGTNILSVDEVVDYSVKQLSNPVSVGLAVGNSVIDWQSCSIYSISKTDNFSTADSISGEHNILIGQSFIARNDANFNSPVLIRILSDVSAGQGKHFQHGYEGWSSYVRIAPLPDGSIIINKGDNSSYVFDAVANSFLKLTASGGSSSVSLPVLGIVHTAASLPVPTSAGDILLNTSDAKLYTVTAQNIWDSGTPLTNGACYASASDFKLYIFDNNSLTSENILDGQIFLNKFDRSVYAYDATARAFIKSGGESFTETHSLSVAEVLAKSFSLTYPVATGQENNIICSVSGVVQIPSIDFFVSGQTLSWNEKGLDSVELEEGDTFIIHYIKE